MPGRPRAGPDPGESEARGRRRRAVGARRPARPCLGPERLSAHAGAGTAAQTTMTPGPAAADSRCAGGALPPSGRVPLRHLKASEARPGPKLTPARAGKARGQPADGATPDAAAPQDAGPGSLSPGPLRTAPRRKPHFPVPKPHVAQRTRPLSTDRGVRDGSPSRTRGGRHGQPGNFPCMRGSPGTHRPYWPLLRSSASLSPRVWRPPQAGRRRGGDPHGLGLGPLATTRAILLDDGSLAATYCATVGPGLGRRRH